MEAKSEWLLPCARVPGTDRSSPLSCSSEDSGITEESVRNPMEDFNNNSKGRINSFYAPHLEAELERLFCEPQSGRDTPDSTGSSTSSRKSVWEDCGRVDHISALDDLEQIVRNLKASMLARQISTTSDDNSESACMSMTSSVSSSPPAEQSGIVAGLAGSNSVAVEEILAKAHLIDILREREQLQRANRSVKKPLLPNTVTSSRVIPVGLIKSASAKSLASKTCVFCRNNGESESVYSSHQLKDPEGNVTCPILYIYTCPICGASGKQSHTIKYCPYNSGEQPLSVIKPLAKTTSARSSAVDMTRYMQLI